MSISRLVFAPYDPVRENEAREFFKEYRHKDFQLRSMGVSKDRVASYLERTLTDQGVQSICLRDGGRMVGLISLQSLPWMSRYFGLKMYAVKHILARSESPLVHVRLLRFVIEELPNIDFLDCRVAVDDILATHALEMCGFRYVGTEVFMGKDLKIDENPNCPEHIIVREYEPEDRRHVLDLAKETHIHNRFVYDPMVSDHMAKLLYANLVANCFKEKQFQIFVAGEHGDIRGFIVGKVNVNFSDVVGLKCGSLDFIGVHPGDRKKGIGVALNSAALSWLCSKGVTFAGVRTLASNYPALKTCLASNFRITSTSLHFHRWIRRPRTSVDCTVSHPYDVIKPSQMSVNQ